MADYPYSSSLTTFNSNTQVTKFYVRNLLETGKAWLVHFFPLQEVKVDGGKDKIAYFKRYAAFSLATTPLTEGVTPAGQTMSASVISATLVQYGDFVSVTDVNDWANEDPVIKTATELLGDQYGETMETIAATALNAGTSVRYADGVAGRTSIVNGVGASDLKVVRRALLANKGKMFNPLLAGSNRVGTQPIGPSFWIVTHTDALATYEAISGWVPVHEYPDPKAAAQYEQGYVMNFRILMSQLAFKSANGGGNVGTTGLISTDGIKVDVYTSLCFAQNAAGAVKGNPQNMELIRKPIGSAGAADPLNQRGTVGWKTMQVIKILNENWLYRIEHGCLA